MKLPAPSGSFIFTMAKSSKPSFFTRLFDKAMAMWQYCSAGVWSDPRRTKRVRAVKILNLSVSSFMDRDLQIRSMSLTYSTVLSLVPALTLMVAIGRGFGLQDLIQNELFTLFPAQKKVITSSLGFVDSYLASASEGLFVGVGIIVLLWTIFSLLSGIEDAFNSIWDIKQGRTLFRKFTDYITICLMVPVLLICSAGISILMSATVKQIFFLPAFAPIVNIILECAPLVLSWLAFTLSFFLFPNTRVKFKYAAVAGAVAAVGFYVLQWLFVTGQIYVSKYNAIYGSFAFLPLLLVWLQFSWLILLSGCVLTYSLQNVFNFNYLGNTEEISIVSLQRMAVIATAVVARRFDEREKLLTVSQMASEYNMPVRILERIVEKLKGVGILNYVNDSGTTHTLGPARDLSKMSVGEFLTIFNNIGDQSPSPEFDHIYAPLIDMLSDADKSAVKAFDRMLLVELPIPTPAQINALIGDSNFPAATDEDTNT